MCINYPHHPQKRKKNKMATYTFEAVKRIYLQATVEADTREEAFEIADKEFIIDDFEETGTDFTWTHS